MQADAGRFNWIRSVAAPGFLCLVTNPVIPLLWQSLNGSVTTQWQNLVQDLASTRQWRMQPTTCGGQHLIARFPDMLTAPLPAEKCPSCPLAPRLDWRNGPTGDALPQIGANLATRYSWLCGGFHRRTESLWSPAVSGGRLGLLGGAICLFTGLDIAAYY